jgi:DNA-binding cell septation regulator SpoVG
MMQAPPKKEATMADLKILAWHPTPRNSLLGFARVALPSGMIVHDVTILKGEHGPWASPPSKPMVSRDGTVMKDDAGKVRYTPIIEFTSKEIRTRWSNSVIEAMRAAHPEVFA